MATRTTRGPLAKTDNMTKKLLIRTLKAILALTILFFAGCNSSTNNKSQNNMISPDVDRKDPVAMLKASIRLKSDKYFTLDKITIILSEEPDLNSNKINIQDFFVEGKSFIPIFSSEEHFTKSMAGVDLGKPVIEINPYLFLSLLSGDETIRVNPSLSDDSNFKASDLKSVYKDEIDKLMIEMSK
jgi:hypothetical protein